MSDRRYVSTGFGPTSSEVGMFDPVTITSTVVAMGWSADCGVGVRSCADTARTEQKTPVTIATHRPVSGDFFMAANWGPHSAEKQAGPRPERALVGPAESLANPATGRRNRLGQ